MNLNLQEIQQADQYNDNTLTAPTDPDLYTIPTTTFSEVDTDTGTDSGTNTNAEIPIRIPIGQAFQSDDESEPIPQHRSSNKDPLLFVVALGLQCNKAGISRPIYVSLLEILRMLGLAAYINNLLACVFTLKKQTIAHLLLIAIRKRKIVLQSVQQSRQKTEEDLVFFDLIDLFTKFLALDVTRTIHLQIGEFYNSYQQDKLYKSQSWTLSICLISSEFVYFYTRQPIFPSNVIIFRYWNRIYGACSNADSSQRTGVFSYLRRVLGIRRDFRSNAV